MSIGMMTHASLAIAIVKFWVVLGVIFLVTFVMISYVKPVKILLLVRLVLTMLLLLIVVSVTQTTFGIELQRLVNMSLLKKNPPEPENLLKKNPPELENQMNYLNPMRKLKV